jgi:cation:H+ antiporter
MDMVTLILFILGLVLLVIGAEALVKGASRLAASVGISPLVIGLTVVAFGTSAPELAVSVQSAYAGQADIAIGNVVGSNIFNVLFILGLSALIVPLVVSQQLVRLDVPLMIGASVLMFLLCLDGSLSRLDGILLFSGVVIYTVWSIRQSRKENTQIQAEYAEAFGGDPEPSGKVKTWIINLGLIVIGLILLVLGSRWLVDGAVMLAKTLGVSELVIGLTIIAAGTSLPEVATSLIASIRGERDIAVGNVVGSNLFNILAVLGLSSIVAPNEIRIAPSALSFDIPVMIAVAIACLPIFFTGNLISRWEGAVFLGYYVAYTLYAILDATEHDALPLFSNVMLFFVLPMTALTLLTVVVRAIRERRAPPPPVNP